MDQPTLWIVGDAHHHEFAEPIACLKHRARCIVEETPAALVESTKNRQGTPEPHAILFLQSRLGQIRRYQVEQLHAAAPLARLVALIGDWCAGENRNGSPWPGVVRIPVHAWQCRLASELGLAEGKSPRLPRTATAIEHLQSHVIDFSRHNHSIRSAAIVTTRRQNYDALADILHQLNVNSVWCFAPDALPCHANCILFDGWEHVPWSSDPGDGTQTAAPRLLLLPFARSEDHARASRLGFSGVLAQPLLLTDMAATFARWPQAALR